MAAHNVQPGSAPANPSRRSALAILGTAPIALLPSLAVLQCSEKADAAPTGSLAEPIRHYRTLLADYDRFDAEVHMPALTASQEAISKVPHHRTRRTYENVLHEHISLSTQDPASVATARKVLADGWTKSDPDYHATLTELANAAKRRDAKIARIEKDFNLRALRKREDDFSKRLCAATSAVVFTEVRSLADLADKADFITETEGWSIDDYQERIVADIRQLARGA